MTEVDTICVQKGKHINYLFLFLQVEGAGLPEGCLAHKGMVHAAKFVQRKLEETRALREGLASRPGYGVVITGKFSCFPFTL